METIKDSLKRFCRKDVTADAKKSYNFDNLDKTKYGFTNTNTFLIKSGRNITVDMTKHTFDNSPAGNEIGTFGLEDNVNFTLKSANITGGKHAVYVGSWNNVCTNLENVAIQETNNSAVIYGSNTSKNMQLNMKNCSVKDTKSNSAVRIATSDANYTMEGCTFENNRGLSGGAIDCPAVNDNNKINNSTFTGNQATDGYGGALNIGKVQISDSKFVDNQSNHWERYASKGAGGAVAAQHFIADKCSFDNNKTNDQGGRGAGVFIEISTDSFYNNLLSNWGNTGSNVCGWSMYTYLKYYSQ